MLVRKYYPLQSPERLVDKLYFDVFVPMDFSIRKRLIAKRNGFGRIPASDAKTHINPFYHVIFLSSSFYLILLFSNDKCFIVVFEWKINYLNVYK